MKTSPRPSKESLRAVLHYLVDCAGAPTGGGGTETAAFGAVQPKPPPKAAVMEVVTFLQQSVAE